MQYVQGIELEQLSDRDLLILAVRAVNELQAQIVAQNSRIRDLEQWRATMTGAFAVLVFAITTFGVYVLGKI